MAWTAPATWSVGQVVNAADLNTHIRDNLNYLKGVAGAFALDAMFTATASDASAVRTGALSSELIVANSNNGGVRASGIKFKANDSGAGGSILSAGRVLGTFHAASFNDSSLVLQTASATETFIDVMTLRGANVGIGIVAPTGKLHVRNVISGCMHWEYDGVDGTARTVIADGAGDVLYRLITMFVSRADDGTTAGGILTTGALIPGGGASALHTTGADTLGIRVNANGSVEVLRSAGTTRTFKVGLWLLWI